MGGRVNEQASELVRGCLWGTKECFFFCKRSRERVERRRRERLEERRRGVKGGRQ